MTTPYSKGLQCKDIPDQMFLDVVWDCQRIRSDGSKGWATIFDVLPELSRRMYDITMVSVGGITIPMRDLAPFDLVDDELPPKLVVKKARKLIRSGRMDGCYCGCRGDFEVKTDVVAPTQDSGKTD